MLGRTLLAADLGNDMRSQDAAFTARVATYEARHGAMNADTLAVAAEAAYLCWFEAEFPLSLLRICQAIGTGVPARLNLCQQVSPERWLDLHHYVAAIQHWLGCSLPLPPALDGDRIAFIGALLGPPTPARRALAEIYLATLIDQLVYSVSLSALTYSGDRRSDDYADFSPWYYREEAGRSATTNLLFLGGAGVRADKLTEAASAALAAESDVSDDLPARLLENASSRCQPPCMHRYTRYLEVRAASIGALKWRGGLPPDPRPRSYWAALYSEASTAIDGWLAGAKPATPLGASIHEALGERDAAKSDMVHMFLKEPPSGTAFWEWMTRAELSAGAMAWQLLGVPSPDAAAA